MQTKLMLQVSCFRFHASGFMLNKIIIVLIWVAVGIGAVWGVGFVMGTRQPSSIGSSLDEFAKCLADNGAKFYGANWCPHCQEQKKVFGSSAKFLDYTECADPQNPRQQSRACADAEISAYPTWIFAGGKKVEGKMSFEALSAETGCKYN